MSETEIGAPSGLLLPPDVIQPFFLRFHRDDLHIMAFFLGHPIYEAVEAMILRRPAGRFAIRAILTRHDQSQIDHINDEALLAQMRGARRDICAREVELDLSPREGGRRARLDFISHAGERIVLEVVTEDQPDPRGGGLTDPGGHSATSSLPLMWRGASTLAGPRTQVTIDGASYAVPIRARTGAVVGYEGYYTEGHAMGVIRAGAETARLVRRPDRLDAGAAWVFETEGAETAYLLAARAPDGRLRIERQGGAGETIIARAVGGRLGVSRISLPGAPGRGEGLTLSFDDADRFRLSMQDAPNLVSGRVECVQTADGAAVTLRPIQPAWAASRAVRVVCAKADDRWGFTTTVGETSRATDPG